jgi:hypothetical protein
MANSADRFSDSFRIEEVVLIGFNQGFYFGPPVPSLLSNCVRTVLSLQYLEKVIVSGLAHSAPAQNTENQSAPSNDEMVRWL